jgi:hypothetical protein
MPIQPINQTSTYGEQGRVEYKPNWGLPITEAGEWRGAPVVSQGVGIDPYAVYNKGLKELNEHYKRREANLKGYGLSQEAHSKAVRQIRQEYDGIRFKFTTTKLQLDDIKQGMASGRINAINGQKAMIQLVSPQGTVEAMFPKPQRQPTVRHGRFSPQQLKTFGENFVEVNKNAIVNPWGWGKSQRKYADPKKLEENYFMFRYEDAYDDMTIFQKKQYDKRYDNSMNVNPLIGKVWRQMVGRGGDPEIRMARTYGARLLDIAAKKAQGVSPFAKALKPKMSLRMKLQAMSPVGAALLSREFAAKRQVAAQRLPTVSTDADYDKLPSGAQFTDPQGNVRTKP